MFSITGEHDHTPFGGIGVQLVWGERADGSHVHISEVPRGLKCDCVCPACGLQLAAHKGEKLAHNFHHVNGQACGGARETNAHVWAKKILEARREVWIPAGVATAGNERKRTFPAQLFKFDSARLEKREGAIVPDVVLSAGKREMIVEILVTHACDDAKIAKIRDQGTSALEIDLSALRRVESEEAVTLALIGTDELRRAPRHWLFNAKVDQASARLATEISRKEAEKRIRLAEAAAHRKAALGWEAQSIIRTAALLKVAPTDATLADLETVKAYQMREHVGLPIQGRGFRVPETHWQSAILARVVMERIDWMRGILPPITPSVAIEAIHRDCLADNVPSLPANDLKSAVWSAEPAFAFSGDAINRYLGELETAGILAREYAHTPGHSAFLGWRVAHQAGVKLRARQTELVERNRRIDRARATLGQIFEQMPDDERRTFSLDRWLSYRIDGIGMRLTDLAALGGERWATFERALDGIARMLRDGPPVQQTFGLPIDGAIATATERERIKCEETARRKREAEERAARQRADSLSHRATAIFGHEGAREWLASMSHSDQLSFIELARHSYEGFNRAQQALGIAEHAHGERMRRQRETERCQTELRAKAIEAFGAERAEVFLLSTHPRIGMSPWARCTDSGGLRDCIALLPARGGAAAARRRV